VAAGHETTATAMSWALLELARNPRVQERCVAEIAEGGELTYLGAVVKETLRLHPVVPMIMRTLQKPATIGGRDYAEGVTVSTSIVLAHRAEEAYPSPQEFDPGRFLDAVPTPTTWLPFGGGARRCIGASFALMEGEVILRQILERYRLEPVGTGREWPRARNVTLYPWRRGRVRLAHGWQGRNCTRTGFSQSGARAPPCPGTDADVRLCGEFSTVGAVNASQSPSPNAEAPRASAPRMYTWISETGRVIEQVRVVREGESSRARGRIVSAAHSTHSAFTLDYEAEIGADLALRRVQLSATTEEYERSIVLVRDDEGWRYDDPAEGGSRIGSPGVVDLDVPLSVYFSSVIIRRLELNAQPGSTERQVLSADSISLDVTEDSVTYSSDDEKVHSVSGAASTSATVDSDGIIVDVDGLSQRAWPASPGGRGSPHPAGRTVRPAAPASRSASSHPGAPGTTSTVRSSAARAGPAAS